LACSSLILLGTADARDGDVNKLPLGGWHSGALEPRRGDPAGVIGSPHPISKRDRAVGSDNDDMGGTGEMAAPVDLDFSPSGYLYATHALHAFAARCPLPLADWAISTFSAPEELVLDPMAGSGTTLIEGCLLGGRVCGVELDPLTHLIAKAKVTPVDLDELQAAMGEVEQLLLHDRVDDGWRPDLPSLDRWFHPHVAAQLAELRRALQCVQAGPDATDLLWVVFSSLIVARTSVANVRDLVHSRHHHRSWPSPPDVHMRFLARLRRVWAMMVDYRRRLEEAASNGQRCG
jgi:DNA methylase